MTTPDDQALTDSVEKLNDTATSLTALMKIVDKNQTLLVKNQEATLENADAISLRSTKAELVTELKKLNEDRKRDRLKTKFTIGVTFLLSLLLIGSIWITANRYHAASVEASNTAASVCKERGDQADATRKFYRARALQVEKDPKITDAYRAEQLALFADLLEHFVPVDCTVLNRTAASLNSKALDAHDAALGK